MASAPAAASSSTSEASVLIQQCRDGLRVKQRELTAVKRRLKLVNENIDLYQRAHSRALAYCKLNNKQAEANTKSIATTESTPHPAPASATSTSAAAVGSSAGGSRVLHLRRANGEFVRIACPLCHRTSFRTATGFMNHTNVQHGLKFSSMDEVAESSAATVVAANSVAVDDPSRHISRRERRLRKRQRRHGDGGAAALKRARGSDFTATHATTATQAVASADVAGGASGNPITTTSTPSTRGRGPGAVEWGSTTSDALVEAAARSFPRISRAPPEACRYAVASSNVEWASWSAAAQATARAGRIQCIVGQLQPLFATVLSEQAVGGWLDTHDSLSTLAASSSAFGGSSATNADAAGAGGASPTTQSPHTASLQRVYAMLQAAGVNVATMPPNSRVSLWDTRHSRKVSGFTAPKAKNLVQYLAARPHLKLYSAAMAAAHT